MEFSRKKVFPMELTIPLDNPGMSNPAVHGFAVCQHISLCRRCVKKSSFESCPVCRENIPGKSTCSLVTVEKGKVEFSEYSAFENQVERDSKNPEMTKLGQ